MSEVLQANIFFYIASVATVVFCIVVTMILFQMYKIMKVFRSILERIDSASETMAEDAAHIRKLVATGGVVSTIMGLVFGAKKKKRAKGSTEADD
jgi:Na+/H+ antiporter NhaD/arsenite permease-like protein